jgi:AcrR family transcriptional regulator
MTQVKIAMPTQTFWNLAPDKRERLIAIALEEFAQNDYQTASVSQIVARAGIAKGSIYQYFQDKRDMFLYLLDVANQTLLAFVQQAPPLEQASDIFGTLRWQMSAAVQAALAHPIHARLIMRAHLMPSPDQEAIAAQARAVRQEHYRALVRDGIARGEVAANVDPEVAAALLGAVTGEIGTLVMATLGLNATQAIAGDSHQFANLAVERIFDQVLQMLEQGLRAKTT